MRWIYTILHSPRADTHNGLHTMRRNASIKHSIKLTSNTQQRNFYHNCYLSCDRSWCLLFRHGVLKGIAHPKPKHASKTLKLMLNLLTSYLLYLNDLFDPYYIIFTLYHHAFHQLFVPFWRLIVPVIMLTFMDKNGLNKTRKTLTKYKFLGELFF